MGDEAAGEDLPGELPQKLSAFFSATKPLKHFLRNLERLSKSLTYISLQFEANYVVMTLPSAAANFYFQVKMAYAGSARLDGLEGAFKGAIAFTLDAATTLKDFQFLADGLPFELQYYPGPDTLYLLQTETAEGEAESLSVLLHQIVVPGVEGEAQGRQAQRAADFFQLGVAQGETLCELRPGSPGDLAMVFESVLRTRSPTVTVAIEQDKLLLTVSELPARGCLRQVEIVDSDWLVLRPGLTPTSFSHDAASFEIVSQLMRRGSSAEQMPRLCFMRQGLMVLSSEFTKDLFRFEVIFTARECF